MRDWLAFFLYGKRGLLGRWAGRHVRTWFGGLT